MQFADYKVRDAVKARVEAGVEVRALLAPLRTSFETDWAAGTAF